MSRARSAAPLVEDVATSVPENPCWHQRVREAAGYLLVPLPSTPVPETQVRRTLRLDSTDPHH